MIGLFKKKDIILKSICVGKIIPIEQVEDKMFSKKLLGDGVGFVLEDSILYAPCDGELVMLAPTKHAIGMKLKNNAEILIHCGLDTVNLNGEGLNMLVSSGEKVKAGQKMLEIDMDLMKQKNICLTTPMILTSQEGYSIDVLNNNGKVTLNDDVIHIIKK